MLEQVAQANLYLRETVRKLARHNLRSPLLPEICRIQSPMCPHRLLHATNFCLKLGSKSCGRSFRTVSRESCCKIPDGSSFCPADGKTDREAAVKDFCGKAERKTDPAAITHVVVMGTGEPFDNYEEVIRFCDRVSDELGILPRHITVSTCGLVPQMYAFAETAKRYHLAVSLHAPDNEIRNRLMPVNRTYPVEAVVKAAADYSRRTKKRVTFEYILLKGINDSPECAEKLARLLLHVGTGKACLLSETERAETEPKKNGWTPEKYFYVNLIPFNAVEEFPFLGTEKEDALRFYDNIMRHGLKATLRKERGTDITAACGQLRRRRNR